MTSKTTLFVIRPRTNWCTALIQCQFPVSWNKWTFVQGIGTKNNSKFNYIGLENAFQLYFSLHLHWPTTKKGTAFWYLDPKISALIQLTLSVPRNAWFSTSTKFCLWLACNYTAIQKSASSMKWRGRLRAKDRRPNSHLFRGPRFTARSRTNIVTLGLRNARLVCDFWNLTAWLSLGT